VLDVGTGRQAVAFLRLGARKISHFDISPEFVGAVQKYIEKNGLAERMSSTQADLVTHLLPTKAFDLVYLNGVIQHVSHIGRALDNCARSSKIGGTFWLYFYRSGTFRNFVNEVLRGLMQGTSMRQVHFAALQFFDGWSRPNLMVSSIMDDLFTPHIQLFSPAQYLAAIDALGFEVGSSSGLLEPEREVNHSGIPESVVICSTRKDVKSRNEFEIESMSPACAVSQTDPGLYADQPEILETLDLFKTLRQQVFEKVDLVARLLSIFRIYTAVELVAREHQSGNVRHAHLQELLANIINAAKDDLLKK
jgi:SAM-dependent methyltransferase